MFLALVRLHDYDRQPYTVHAEELLYGWSGLYLIETGVPRSWSALDYSDDYLVFDGRVGPEDGLYLYGKLYEPWLDEPPLFSLILGATAKYYGADRDQVIPASYMRLPVVLASLVTMALVLVVTWRWFGYWTGMLALVIYGSSPLIVFASRLAVPENMFALAVIGSVWWADVYGRKSGWGFPIFIGVISLLLGLMKPTGFFFAPLGIFWVVKNGNWRHIWPILVGLLLGVVAFLAYGYHYGWELFMHIVEIQGGRFAGWSGLPYIFVKPAFDIFEFIDGWYILAFFLTSWIVFREQIGLGTILGEDDVKKKLTKEERIKSERVYLLGMWWLFWLLVAIFGGTEQDLLPWYWFSMFPILAVLGGVGLRALVRRASFLSLVLVVGMLLSSRWHLSNAFRPTTDPWVFRWLVAFLVAPGLVDMVWPSDILKKISRAILIGVIVMGVWLNSKYVYSVFAVRCESKTCPIGPSTAWSEVRVPYFWRWLNPGDPEGLLDENRPWL